MLVSVVVMLSRVKIVMNYGVVWVGLLGGS